MLFLLFTDEKLGGGISEFIDRFDPVVTFHQKSREFSDLILMSQADLLICSQSSYSMWGAFLSQSYYMMYLPYLIQKDDRTAFLWDEELYTSDQDCFSTNAKGRGYAAKEDGRLPDELLERLDMCLSYKKAKGIELIFGGRYRVQ